jgi:hypothetical protein
MTDDSGLLQGRTILIAAAIGIFGLDLTASRAEVLGQTAIEMGGRQTANRLSPGEAKERGIRLRAELDKAFDAVLDSGKADHADKFTTIVLPYISAGMALEDAEGVLRAAGFTEPPRPGASEEQNRSNGGDWHAIVAEIPQFSGRVFGSVEAYVMLLPPAQGLAEYIGRRRRMTYYPHSSRPGPATE